MLLLPLLLAQINYQTSPQTPGVQARMVEQSGTGSIQHEIGPGWQKIIPLRHVTHLGKLLSDLESQMPEQHAYRDNDKVVWAHETTHGINSRARQTLPPRYNTFYCFKTNIFVLPEPNVTKTQIQQFVPRNLYGHSFDLYLGNPAPTPEALAQVPPGTIIETQEKIPLHIIDEWTAYLNGLEVSQELNLRNTSDGDLEHAVELAGYASALIRCIEQYDLQYRYKAELITYCNYCLDRTGRYLPSTPKQTIKQHAQGIKQFFSQGDGHALVPVPTNSIISGSAR